MCSQTRLINQHISQTKQDLFLADWVELHFTNTSVMLVRYYGWVCSPFTLLFFSTYTTPWYERQCSKVYPQQQFQIFPEKKLIVIQKLFLESGILNHQLSIKNNDERNIPNNTQAGFRTYVKRDSWLSLHRNSQVFI